ncbi:acetylornithine transaminase [Methanonatronarchaeum sp. AMET6-2]|uniref:acetylornithine transaminase n=1 Tax=Methanonatronarchaeum sp. AMET6-2 TaxID=2933293 RepID=UPI0011FBAA8F|nr:acetylornithine transaminase [Methanonatronarchaeum sp. AMET6-2]RZN63002.1 MAG: acetylornithine transaminase [Methanonatronarchaeia archaeon]UOY09986.1 acetylornithine transaminase [Methanonatronarchaeum sp. AMET6-2]
MSYEEIAGLSEKHLIGVYNRLPIAIEKGRGTRVWDSNGNEYLDFVAGIAVNNVGHCHPKVVEAVKKQVGSLIHCSNLYHIESQARLAEKITELSFADQLFFANSGTEANEAAIKLARKATGNTEVIACSGSFHGRSLGALSATWKDRYRGPFKPLVPGFSFVSYGDTEEIKNRVSGQTAAVIIEPIQGEGGVNLPPEGYLKAVRDICTDTGTTLIFDEVQTGFGRTGEWFGYQHHDITPDIMSLAKSLGGGLPIGAMAAKEEIASEFEPGDHASTFGGNPVACEAALATINTIQEENLVEKSKVNGEYMREKLKNLENQFEWAEEVRGRGLMNALETDGKAQEIVDRAYEQNVLLNKVSDDVLRFVPPLTVTEKEIDKVVNLIG